MLQVGDSNIQLPWNLTVLVAVINPNIAVTVCRPSKRVEEDSHVLKVVMWQNWQLYATDDVLQSTLQVLVSLCSPPTCSTTCTFFRQGWVGGRIRDGLTDVFNSTPTHPLEISGIGHSVSMSCHSCSHLLLTCCVRSSHTGLSQIATSSFAAWLLAICLGWLTLRSCMIVENLDQKIWWWSRISKILWMRRTTRCVN